MPDSDNPIVLMPVLLKNYVNTGKLKYVDTAGRIEKFQNKFAAGSYASLQKKGAKKKAPKPAADS